MNHSCGCLSAEECWQSCCCYTNAEKVAWAAANAVDLPDYVREAAESESAPCQAEPVEKCPACAAAHPHCDEPAMAELALPVRWVFGPAAARCHGGPVASFQTVPALPPSAPSVLTITQALTITLSPADPSATKLSSPPLDPPPRTS